MLVLAYLAVSAKMYRMSSIRFADGFKMYRKQTTMDITPEQWREFVYNFPDHFLYGLGKCALDLVKRRETKRFIDGATRNVPVNSILRAAIMHGGKSARKGINVEPVGLKFDQPETNGHRHISILVDDKRGILEEERTKILDSLGKVTGTSVAVDNFVPRIEIGRAPLNPYEEAIKSLEPMVPDEIYLERMLVYPYSKTIWQKNKHH